MGSKKDPAGNKVPPSVQNVENVMVFGESDEYQPESNMSQEEIDDIREAYMAVVQAQQDTGQE